MEILIVGAGAVGKVFAHHLQLGGARVSLYVRPPRREEALRGYALHRIHTRRSRTSAHFVPDAVVSSERELAASAFDQVWLCVPEDALASLDEVLRAIGDANVVSLIPGAEVRSYLERFVRPDRLVIGEIGFLSYASPLHGSDADYERATPSGTAYYAPPLGSSFCAGRPASEIVRTLRRGRFPARVSASTELDLLYSSGFIIPMVAALELSGWSVSVFRRQNLPLGARAAHEAISALAKRQGRGATQWLLLSRAIWLLRVALFVAPVLAPFDLAAFFRAHFGKLPAQTTSMLGGYLDEARRRAVPTPNLSELATQLEASRRAPSGESTDG